MGKQLNLFEKNDNGARFSKCKRYRYTLWRKWASGKTCLWIMLNPSTACSQFNDPTVERCERRSRRMKGFGKMVVCNIFAYRATAPEDMKRQKDPVGPENNQTILDEAMKADKIICAWGNHGSHHHQSAVIVEMLKLKGVKLHYLKMTSEKEPGHPLYIGYEQQPVAWSQ